MGFSRAIAFISVRLLVTKGSRIVAWKEPIMNFIPNR